MLENTLFLLSLNDYTLPELICHFSPDDSSGDSPFDPLNNR